MFVAVPSLTKGGVLHAFDSADESSQTGYIIISAVLCVLGAVLIAFPDFSVSLLGVICGITMIVFGIVKLTGYFSKDLYRLAFQYDLTSESSL